MVKIDFTYLSFFLSHMHSLLWSQFFIFCVVFPPCPSSVKPGYIESCLPVVVNGTHDNVGDATGIEGTMSVKIGSHTYTVIVGNGIS